MSWSVGVKDLPVWSAKAQIEEQFRGMDHYPCPEPEESIKQSARKLIAEALDGTTREGAKATVSAYGSQLGTLELPHSYSLSVSIQIS